MPITFVESAFSFNRFFPVIEFGSNKVRMLSSGFSFSSASYTVFRLNYGQNSKCSVNKRQEMIMKAEFTAIIEAAPEGGYWAICPEVPGANGQGETIEETKDSLRQAIELILEDRKADILRGLPEDAIQDKVLIG